MRSLADLQEPDQRTLRFAPLGLLTTHKLRPDSAAEYQQRLVDIDLVEAVPEQVRETMDRVRELHAYGVLSYDLFTAAHDLTRLILEQALRTRFMEHYKGTVPFADKSAAAMPLTAQTFEDVYEALNKSGGSHRKARFLRAGAGPEIHEFRATLPDLLAWARREGLLHGQRNRLAREHPGRYAQRGCPSHELSPAQPHRVRPCHP